MAILALVGFIMLIVSIVKSTETIISTSSYTWSYYSTPVYEDQVFTDLWYGVAGIAIFAISAFVSFIMGIITLATMNKAINPSRGLIITSGILGIMGGVFGINAIISFIAAAKEK